MELHGRLSAHNAAALIQLIGVGDQRLRNSAFPGCGGMCRIHIVSASVRTDRMTIGGPSAGTTIPSPGNTPPRSTSEVMK